MRARVRSLVRRLAAWLPALMLLIPGVPAAAAGRDFWGMDGGFPSPIELHDGGRYADQVEGCDAYREIAERLLEAGQIAYTAEVSPDSFTTDYFSPDAYDPGSQRVVFYQKGRLELGEESREFLVFALRRDGDGILIPLYLLVGRGEDWSCRFLERGIAVRGFPADLDGDGREELTVYVNNGGNGGNGVHTNLIYRWQDGRLEELYKGEIVQCVEVTGFTLTLEDGWRYTIHCEPAGFSYTFRNFKAKGWVYGCFEEDGTVSTWGLENQPIGNLASIRNFDVFYPRDVDGDGRCEILTAEPFGLGGGDGYLGVAYCALRFDPEDGSLTPVRAGFWPFPLEDRFPYRLQVWLRSYYEAHWHLDGFPEGTG